MIITVLSPKGGTGKSTTTANMAGYLSDQGLKVLMVDADPQQTLTSHYPFTAADYGLNRIITEVLVEDTISKTDINGLDLVYQDDPDGDLEEIMRKAVDGPFRLRIALEQLRNDYDIIFVDTVGTKKGKYLELGIYAGDIILTPIVPESAASREFVRSSVKTVRNKQVESTRLGYKSAPMVGFINSYDGTVDAKRITASIYDTANKLEPPVPMLETILHRVTAFPSATTARQPIHRYEPNSTRKSGSANDMMRELIEEFFSVANELIGRPDPIPSFTVLKEVKHG